MTKKMTEDESLDREYLNALYVVGEYYLGEGAEDFGTWSQLLVDECGEFVRPYLQPVWDRIHLAGQSATRQKRGDTPLNAARAIDANVVAAEALKNENRRLKRRLAYARKKLEEARESGQPINLDHGQHAGDPQLEPDINGGPSPTVPAPQVPNGTPPPPPKSAAKRWVLFGLAGFVAALYYFGNHPQPPGSDGRPTQILASTSQQDNQKLPVPLTTAQIAELAQESVVVLLSLDDSGQPTGQGSGFVVSPGIIATAHHVIKDAVRWEVVLPKHQRVPVERVLAVDSDRDVALVRVGVDLNLKALEIGTEQLRSGDHVVVVASPEGFVNTVSEGIVSGFRSGRQFFQSRPDNVSDWQVIQTTAAISPGSSGGPVFDIYGRVIGIVDATWSDAHSQALNFAVPTQYVADLLRQQGEVAAYARPNLPGPPPVVSSVPPITPPSPPQLPPEIGKLLSTWVQSTLRGDLTSQVKCYGPQVEVFFTKRDITREDVRLEKQKVLTEFPEVKAYDISGLEIESAGADRVVINFRKRWDSSGNTGKQFSGEEKERLTLARFGEQWLIVGEEELQIFRVHKGK